MEITTNSLYEMVLRETKSETALDLDPETYRAISELLGRLQWERYDGIEGRINTVLSSMNRSLASLLLRIRLEKGVAANLLDEEKYILDAGDSMKSRHKTILDYILDGRPRLLESITRRHKTDLTAVRFLKAMDQMVGVDMEGYGPFKREDVAIIPRENARVLVAKKIAVGLGWGEGP